MTVLLSALEVVFEIVIPLYMSNLIDFGIEGGSMAAVWKFGAFLLLLAAFQLATGVLAARIAARASVGFGANLREDMYNNVQTFAFSNIDKFSTASIVTRLTTDVTNVQNAFQMAPYVKIDVLSCEASQASAKHPLGFRGRSRLKPLPIHLHIQIMLWEQCKHSPLIIPLPALLLYQKPARLNWFHCRRGGALSTNTPAFWNWSIGCGKNPHTNFRRSMKFRKILLF